MTLNMLRRSQINSKMSLCTQIFGMFDYNATPLTPLGTKAFVYERPIERARHADHGKIGYAIGPSMKHYCHLNYYIPSTHSTRNTNTYVFILFKFESPVNVVADRATAALEELTAALKGKRMREIPVTKKSVNNAIYA